MLQMAYVMSQPFVPSVPTALTVVSVCVRIIRSAAWDTFVESVIKAVNAKHVVEYLIYNAMLSHATI
jgi:hypothetical protein